MTCRSYMSCDKITYRSHKATCRHDMSPVLFARVYGHREGPQLVYLQTCRKCMSHERTVQCPCDILLPRRVAWIQTRGVELHKNIPVTRGDFSRGQVASCDRTFRMSMLWFVYLTVTTCHIQYTFLSLCRWKWTKHENTWSLPFSYYKKKAADSYQACKALILSFF